MKLATFNFLREIVNKVRILGKCSQAGILMAEVCVICSMDGYISYKVMLADTRDSTI
jgi:hypothetical protein